MSLTKHATRNVNVTAQQADNSQVHINQATDLYIKPTNSECPGVLCELLVVPSLNQQVLGCDMVVGLPTLYALELKLDMKNHPASLLWQKRLNHSYHNNNQCTQIRTPIEISASVMVPMTKPSPINRLLEEYSDIFAEQLQGSYIRDTFMRIQLKHQLPIAAKPKRHSADDETEIEAQIKRLMDHDIVEETHSCYAATCRLVPKRNGKKRMVHNYIPLNRATVRDQHPMPVPSRELQHLQGSKYFSTLDATEGFHQVSIHPEDRHYTAFITAKGLYQYRRVPFGFTNSPAVFQRCMNRIFGEGLGKRCLVYIDDVLVFGRTPEEHHANLAWVFQKCRSANLKLNPAKFLFFQEQVQFLGRVISAGGVSPITDDLDILTRNGLPTNKEELRSLIGHLVFVSRFIPEYSETTHILNELLHKDKKFIWTDQHTQVVHKIRRILTSSATQKFPDIHTPKCEITHLVRKIY